VWDAGAIEPTDATTLDPTLRCHRLLEQRPKPMARGTRT
jgi:hypothetical protein